MISLRLVCFIFLLCRGCGQVSGQRRAKQARLVNNLLGDLNPDIIPKPNSGGPVNVTLTCYLIDILDVDIERNQVEMLLYLTREYNDDALMWNPTEFETQTILLRRDSIWTTDLEIENDIGTSSNQPPSPAMAEVKNDGSVTLFDRRRIRIECQVYALSDRHAAECPIKISSDFYERSDLALTEPTENTANGLLFSDASKYILIGLSSRKDTIHYATGSFETMVVTVRFGRITPPSD